MAGRRGSTASTGSTSFRCTPRKGYAVFFTNPRGSTGYGRKFQRGIELQWGGNDYIDIMNGVHAAIAANPWIDTTRLGVTGGSYGGYMTNWIVGHTGPLQGRGDAAEHLELHQRRRHPRRRVRP